ncbi:hypothetical protein NLM27_41270 [Bradyrhizobium sp. CCGB12]|uniref:hypothetical protein n=1 Tax=Bradyrhizobium sp. CCGB12 TaxID=2949632 RepID=UPI0020B18435|nr:hypothetical protein [Bradyrhizobium sp. CCGB12]MCP3395177.1 hypothetical protein [Bradyrhizobium sp. CCGB12]
MIDGKAVILGVDGTSDFNALHSRKLEHEVQLYAFDILSVGGENLLPFQLHMRKANLEQLLARWPDGDQSEARSGPTCSGRLPHGLEGLVSKHRYRPYRGGRQKLKVKNRTSTDVARAVTRADARAHQRRDASSASRAVS